MCKRLDNHSFACLREHSEANGYHAEAERCAEYEQEKRLHRSANGSLFDETQPDRKSASRREYRRVVFEVQRRLRNGEWKGLGLARTPGDHADFDGALEAFCEAWNGPLPQGSYRTRAARGDGRWLYGAVDRRGRFSFLS
jgi:hypothetical protein